MAKLFVDVRAMKVHCLLNLLSMNILWITYSREIEEARGNVEVKKTEEFYRLMGNNNMKIEMMKLQSRINAQFSIESTWNELFVVVIKINWEI